MTGIKRGYDDPEKQWLKLKNEWARDASIDWGALGLLTYLTSHRDGYQVALEELTSVRNSKRHRVMGWLGELERANYIRRETKRTKGVIVGTVWHLLDPSNVGGQH